MSNAPERIWINKVHGLHPEDWDFTDGAHLTKAQLRQKVEYVRADLATPTHAEQLQQALVMPEIKALVDALQAFNTYEKSAFFGSAAEKNKQAVYRGVKRKITKALAAVGVKP